MPVSESNKVEIWRWTGVGLSKMSHNTRVKSIRFCSESRAFVALFLCQVSQNTSPLLQTVSILLHCLRVKGIQCRITPTQFQNPRPEKGVGVIQKQLSTTKHFTDFKRLYDWALDKY